MSVRFCYKCKQLKPVETFDGDNITCMECLRLGSSKETRIAKSDNAQSVSEQRHVLATGSPVQMSVVSTPNPVFTRQANAQPSTNTSPLMSRVSSPSPVFSRQTNTQLSPHTSPVMSAIATPSPVFTAQANSQPSPLRLAAGWTEPTKMASPLMSSPNVEVRRLDLPFQTLNETRREPYLGQRTVTERIRQGQGQASPTRLSPGPSPSTKADVQSVAAERIIQDQGYVSPMRAAPSQPSPSTRFYIPSPPVADVTFPPVVSEVIPLQNSAPLPPFTVELGFTPGTVEVIDFSWEDQDRYRAAPHRQSLHHSGPMIIDRSQLAFPTSAPAAMSLPDMQFPEAPRPSDAPPIVEERVVQQKTQIAQQPLVYQGSAPSSQAVASRVFGPPRVVETSAPRVVFQAHLVDEGLRNIPQGASVHYQAGQQFRQSIVPQTTAQFGAPRYMEQGGSGAYLVGSQPSGMQTQTFSRAGQFDPTPVFGTPGAPHLLYQGQVSYDAPRLRHNPYAAQPPNWYGR